MRKLFIAFSIYATLLPAATHADCTNPDSASGGREWFTAENVYKYCDGTNWIDFSLNNTLTECSNTATLEYDNNLNGYRFCDGTNWRQIGCTASNTQIEINGAECLATCPELGTCNNPGQIDYLTELGILAYCNGSNLISLENPIYELAPGSPSCIGINPWTSYSISTNPGNRIVYGAGRFISLSNPRMTSTDGINWSAIPTYFDGSDAIYAGGRWLAVSGSWNRAVATSSNGVNWTTHSGATPTTANWSYLAYGNGRYVATTWGSNGFMSSTDGLNWTRHNGPDRVWFGTAYGNGVFVAISHHTAEVAVSPDGINWTLQSFQPFGWTHANSITYGNGRFVVVAGIGDRRIASSSDGINWTTHIAPQQNYWKSVTYGDGLFVAVAEDGINRVMTSTDGLNWISMPAAQANEWINIAYGSGRYVSISRNGTNRIMTTDCISASCDSP